MYILTYNPMLDGCSMLRIFLIDYEDRMVSVLNVIWLDVEDSWRNEIDE